MDKIRQKLIEELISLQQEYRAETDPKKKEKIWREIRTVQTLGINSLYGAYSNSESKLFSNKTLDRR